MRSTVIACAALLVTAVFAILSPWIIGIGLGRIEEAALLVSDAGNVMPAAERLCEEIERERLALSLFLSDSTIRDLRGYASDVLAAAEDGNSIELQTAKSRLIGLINQQRRLSSFDLEAIL